MGKKQQKPDLTENKDKPATIQQDNVFHMRIGQIGEYKPIPKFNSKCPNC